MTGGIEQGVVADSVAVPTCRVVRARIAAAARSVGHDPGAVTLVAVSKAQPDARVVVTLEAGKRVFGENYMQEAKAGLPSYVPAI